MSRPRSRISAPILLGAVLLGATIPETMPYLTTSMLASRVYTVSASRGSDAYAGSFTAPFATIGHCAAVVRPGEMCAVEGGTYREMVVPARGGTAEAPITYTVSGSDPVIVTGADPITSTWVRVGASAVYTTPRTLPVARAADTGFLANQIFVDGVMMPLARAPNVTSFDPLAGTATLLADGSTTTGTLHSSSIPALDWTAGGIAHYWGTLQWIARTAPITSTSASQVGFAPPLAGCPNICASAGTPFYLEGAPAALDAPGEWVYTDTTHTLALWAPAGDSPGAHLVEAKTRTWAFDLSNKSYITISGFHLFAASITTTQYSSYDTIDAITATYLSHFITVPEDPVGHLPYLAHAFDTGIVISGTHNTLENSDLSYSAGNGISLSGSYNAATNNLLSGMDYSGSYDSAIAVIAADHSTVTQNTLHDMARDGIHGGNPVSVTFASNTISYNDIYNFGLRNNDLGGIYVCCGHDGTGSVMAYNWIHDDKAVAGPGRQQGAGIYIDNGDGRYLIHHNVIWNAEQWGILLNNNTTNAYGTAQGVNSLYNNTLAGGQTNSIWQEGGADASIVKNNIVGTTLHLAPGQANSTPNTPGTVAYVDAARNDYRLGTGSAAIDAGVAVVGITEGFAGGAPDAGGYEFGAPTLDWIPGCRRVECRDPSVPNRHPDAP